MALFDLSLGALAVVLCTGLGAGFVFALRCIDKPAYSVMLAFSAGAMAFSSMEMLSESHDAAGDASFAGFIAGLAFLAVVERMLPHIHRHVLNGEM
ncbi:MAG: hypothetical protein AB1324_00500, partial [Candidatus Micrarchaeota archaeon]